MHLAVLGGTFDPPHNGHLALCLYARELLEIEKIIISVSNNPFKHSRGATDQQQNGSIVVIDFACEVSSTEIRELVASGKSVSRLLPPSVNRYIIENNLYRNTPLTTLTPEQKRRES